MSLEDLESFLNEDNDKEEVKFDSEKEKQKWLDSVQKLYQDIDEWLKPLGEKAIISYEKMILDEEKIGEYEINQMVINLKGNIVRLKPIGTLIIGSRGRIDMLGNYGTVMFTWVDKLATKPKISVRFFNSKEEMLAHKPEKPKQVEYAWKIMTPAPNVKYIPLNEETFSDSLLSVIKNG
ncbi:hypothetical protein AWH48_16470 [Domibacillus aminovorans]|uniref:Uncharacterized protein n=1 Tax=Domibacillus aminovorans TaxID=29332 RepID=A0A177KZ20_9BACI|nr:hypothetical protein [Domibacillus aminovorans]OAH58600.1 hypothetical protein AWH48_16470 [Domibacillus aminovorans]